MSGSVAKLKYWIGGTKDAAIPGVISRDHTQVVTPLTIPIEPGGNGFGNASVIAASVVIEGPIHGVGPFVIAGSIHGDVRVKGDVLILPSAWIEGSVTGLEVEIHGRVKGRIDAELIVLRCKGHVVGDVTCGELRVDGGGRLDGRCSMEATNEVHLAAVPRPPPFGVLSA